MKNHMLTMPLPTNLAFYSYYISDGWLKITTIYVNLSELVIPWLFFAPFRTVRIFAFYWLLFLQICIIATGNNGYLPFMIIAMMVSILDDKHFKSRDNGGGVSYKSIISFALTLMTIFGIYVITTRYYRITYADGKLDATICELNKIINLNYYDYYHFFRSV
jgi:hypothetical protein